MPPRANTIGKSRTFTGALKKLQAAVNLAAEARREVEATADVESSGSDEGGSKKPGDDNDADAGRAAQKDVRDRMYVGGDAAEDVKRRLVHLRDNTKFTRSMIAEMAGSTSAKIWRMERGRVRNDEYDAITGALDRIESGEVPEPERAMAATKVTETKSALKARQEFALAKLREAEGVDDAEALQKIIDDAIVALDTKPQAEILRPVVESTQVAA